MRIIMILFFCLVSFSSTSQLWMDFRNSIYECIDSFQIKNPKKHKQITGISIIVNYEGELVSYNVRFKNQTMKLSKSEYRWLFKLLSQENYKKYENVFYSNDELKYLKEFKYSVKYISKELRSNSKLFD